MQIKGEYKRVFGDKLIVTVIGIQNGIVQIKDCNGRHFVREDSFHQFFKKVS